MDVLTNLRTFLMVARCGGFSEAARHLHVVPSVAAKRVSQLEKTVGAPLFNRTTRSIRLTESGEQLRARAADLVAGFEDVVHGLKHDERSLSGPIRVMAPTTVTVLFLGRVFAAFVREHPKVRLEIELMDRSTNPLEQGFDIAISGRSAIYDGVNDVPLCSVKPLLCAAPTYLAAKGWPSHPRELRGHDCLVFRPAGFHWSFQSQTEGVCDVDVAGARVVADDNLSLRESAEAGCGLAILPSYVARQSVAAGRLTVVLPEYPPTENWFRAYVPRRKMTVPRVKALLDHITFSIMALNAGEPPIAVPKSVPVKAKPGRRRVSKA